ncbi:STAS domain-containing protein [Novosphingobium cyanobacteriorum]|uniref:STAS domain-containing protein n=1 Tax=Novosphingobium cyanobacteriorum TaxID=3024215 RepID=A0ABT6CE03_9SPHN|nr:STAS domain-containing protein [Novosphingobium cyanobacteriorum]MDF8332154.1 STAS domain-containing protein [Novosphingobium cyanobacteriorum]
MTVVVGKLASIGTIESIRDAIIEAFDAGSEVEIDASALEDADLTFVQVLASAHKQAEIEGRSVRIVAPVPPVLASLAERAGLHDLVSVAEVGR